jgi:hypothetical protein
MTVLFVPRSAWFAGTPTSNAGTPRPRLKVPVPTITRHYTGSPPIARAATWTAEQFMPDFQRIALASGKSYEYNYVIPPRTDSSSQVWEYAGTFQAAHSQGENDVAIGVLFAIGVANHPSYANYDKTKPTVWEPLTDSMVEAYRWLRDRLLFDAGYALPSVAQIEHRAMPGALTACPGNSVIGRAADLLAPTPPASEEPVPLKLFNVKPSALNAGPLFASGDGVTAVWVSGEQWAALGNPPATDLLDRAKCRQWTLVGECPDGYRGIWGGDTHA